MILRADQLIDEPPQYVINLYTWLLGSGYAADLAFKISENLRSFDHVDRSSGQTYLSARRRVTQVMRLVCEGRPVGGSQDLLPVRWGVPYPVREPRRNL